MKTIQQITQKAIESLTEIFKDTEEISALMMEGDGTCYVCDANWTGTYAKNYGDIEIYTTCKGSGGQIDFETALEMVKFEINR